MTDRDGPSAADIVFASDWTGRRVTLATGFSEAQIRQAIDLAHTLFSRELTGREERSLTLFALAHFDSLADRLLAAIRGKTMLSPDRVLFAIATPAFLCRGQTLQNGPEAWPVCTGLSKLRADIRFRHAITEALVSIDPRVRAHAVACASLLDIELAPEVWTALAHDSDAGVRANVAEHFARPRHFE